MYAIIRQGGKQYMVRPGDTIFIERIAQQKGEEFTHDDVLAVNTGDSYLLGAPKVPGATVRLKVRRHGRGPKIHIWKFRRRKGYSKRQGHRQSFVQATVEEISLNGKALAAN
jgi:large subunit ribosomal protein L21